MPTTTSARPVTGIPAAPAAEAARHFAGRLAFETDVVDVAAALAGGSDPVVLLDVRSRASYERAHAAGAISAPAAEIDGELLAALPAGQIVVYCWGPGCNGAHRAALRVAEHGRTVKEMIGGFEYWVREGRAVEGHGAADPRYAADDSGLVSLPRA